MVLKEQILNSFLLFERYGGLERTDYLTVSTLVVCVVLERTDFNSLYFGRMCWS